MSMVGHSRRRERSLHVFGSGSDAFRRNEPRVGHGKATFEKTSEREYFGVYVSCLRGAKDTKEDV
jgi:hypothetical protein